VANARLRSGRQLETIESVGVANDGVEYAVEIEIAESDVSIARSRGDDTQQLGFRARVEDPQGVLVEHGDARARRSADRVQSDEVGFFEERSPRLSKEAVASELVPVVLVLRHREELGAAIAVHVERREPALADAVPQSRPGPSRSRRGIGMHGQRAEKKEAEDRCRGPMETNLLRVA